MQDFSAKCNVPACGSTLQTIRAKNSSHGRPLRNHMPRGYIYGQVMSRTFFFPWLSGTSPIWMRPSKHNMRCVRRCAQGNRRGMQSPINYQWRLPRDCLVLEAKVIGGDMASNKLAAQHSGDVESSSIEMLLPISNDIWLKIGSPQAYCVLRLKLAMAWVKGERNLRRWLKQTTSTSASSMSFAWSILRRWLWKKTSDPIPSCGNSWLFAFISKEKHNLRP